MLLRLLLLLPLLLCLLVQVHVLPVLLLPRAGVAGYLCNAFVAHLQGYGTCKGCGLAWPGLAGQGTPLAVFTKILRLATVLKGATQTEEAT